MQVRGSIQQYFRPALSYHMALRPLFCLFLSGHTDKYRFHCTNQIGNQYSKTSLCIHTVLHEASLFPHSVCLKVNDVTHLAPCDILCMYMFNSLLACDDFCRVLIIFAKSLDPDQDRHNVGPDLDPNHLTLCICICC